MQELLHLATLSTIVSLSNPLELVKSRFQTMAELVDRGTISKNYTSITDCVKRIKLNEGIQGLWKGNGIGLARFFPNQFINNWVKNSMQALLPSSPVSNIISGILGGWTSALVLYPIDTVRIFISTSTQKSLETLKELKISIKQ